jgi:hypothetical protein
LPQRENRNTKDQAEASSEADLGKKCAQALPPGGSPVAAPMDARYLSPKHLPCSRMERQLGSFAALVRVVPEHFVHLFVRFVRHLFSY